MDFLEFCCNEMGYRATHKNDLIVYMPECRKYTFVLHNDEDGTLLEMHYCPWCGTKLPKELVEEWSNAIKQNLGIEDIFAEEWEQLPEKYKTDQWWKELAL